MDENLIYKKFKRFLKENGIYIAFIKNFKEQEKARFSWTKDYFSKFKKGAETSFEEISVLKQYCNSIENKTLFIQFAFYWDDTKEGYRFWQQKNYEWFNTF